MSFFGNHHHTGSRTVNQYGAVKENSFNKMPMPSTRATPSSTSNPPPPVYSSNEAEDPRLTKLREYDTVFLVDDSGSMKTEMAGECTPIRWPVAGKALAEIVDIAAQYDEDGVDIHFINSKRRLLGAKDADAVLNLFDSIEPEGLTKIGKRLKKLLPDGYMKQAKRASQEKGSWPKRLNFLIITDGEATDCDTLERFLDKLAKKLHEYDAPPGQLGYQFIQIGNTPSAARFLQKLDGDHKEKEGRRDIVDTVKATQDHKFDSRVLMKALIGGINRGMDGQRR